MRAILVALMLVAAALAAPKYEPIFTDYHAQIGIPNAARIRAAEQAMDFDGSRVTGGSPAPVGLYPFMGGLVIQVRGGLTSSCGSSLLSNTRLVTAAHCWRHRAHQALSFVVVLGSVRLFSGGERIQTNDVEMHSQYDERTINNDIAIIRIRRVAFTSTINRINLPTNNNAFVGVIANVIGFGQTGDNISITTAQVLSHTRVPVISNAECQRTFGPWVVIHSTICTSGAGGRGPCPGDSGGPLQIPGPILIGVSSFNPFTGCQGGGPSGYARVSAFLSWIRQRL